MHYSLRSKIALVFYASCVLACPISYAQKSDALVDKVVATVKSEPILYSELEEAQSLLLAELRKSGKDSDLGSPKEMQRKVLEQLINDKIVAQEIRRLGMTADEAAIDNAVQSVMRENRMSSIEDLQRALKSEGIVMSDFRDGIKKQLEQSNFMNRYVRPKVRIEPEDVERAFRQKNGESGKVEKLRVQMIFKLKPKATKQTMEKLSKKLQTAKFEEVAKKETEGPGKEDGGDIGYVAPGDLQKELSDVLASMKAGELSKTIETSQGFYILKCVDKKMEDAANNQSAKNALKEQLFREEMNRVFEATIHSLREKSNIQIFL